MLQNNDWIWSARHSRYYRVIARPGGAPTYVWAAETYGTQGSSSNAPATGTDMGAQARSQTDTANGTVDDIDMSVAKADFGDKDADSDAEELDPTYHGIEAKDEWGFWIPGRVFKALTLQETGGTGPSIFKYGDVYAKIYRFIVIKANPKEHWSDCLRITTHGGQGCTKSGLDQSKHTIVYTSPHPPPKLPGENKMNKDPIKIVPVNQTEKLDPISRVNLAKTYPIEHNIRVKEVGQVSMGDLKKLQGYCRACK